MINPLYGVNCLKLGFERYIRYSKINASIRCSRTSVSFYVNKGNGEKSMNARASNHHPNLQNYTKGSRKPWLSENISVEFVVPKSFEDETRIRTRVYQNARGTISPFNVTIYQYNSDLIEPTDIIEIFKAIIKFLNGNGYTDPFARSQKKAKIISRTANIKSNKSSAKEIREMKNNNRSICNESELNEIAYLCLGDIIEKKNNDIKESKYMKKNRIRLTESQLNRMIRESVKNVLQNLEYRVIGEFGNGYYLVGLLNSRNNRLSRFNFIDANGQLQFDEWFDSVYEMGDPYFTNPSNFARVTRNRRTETNLVNADCELVSDVWYDYIYYTAYGAARVYRSDHGNDRFNYIRLSDGKLISDMWFESADEEFRSEKGAKVKRSEDGLYNYINLNGEFLEDEWFYDNYGCDDD